VPHRKQLALVPIKPAVTVTRAAAYVRMSRESQEYSPVNQMALINKYASDHDMQIVKTYSDKGISGLKIENRPGLRALLTEVVGGSADFSKLLVYDVSRWGRFQDLDESGHYEFICRRAGVEVIYCAELFGADNSLISMFGKMLKRGAAAEFSRELSVRIFRAKCHLASRGFLMGGTPPFGMKTVLVDANGKRIYGPISADRKVYSDFRLSLVPGPVKEVRVVREIFRRYVELGESGAQITRFLNASGTPTMKGGKWHQTGVNRILENETYAGTQVYNTKSGKMGTTPRRNPPSEWIRKPNAFPHIIDPEVFEKAQEIRRERRRKLSDEELLILLRRLLAKRGRLTERMIARQKDMPCVYEYVNRFGSLFNAYRMIGYYGNSKHRVWQERLKRRQLRKNAMESIRSIVESAGLSFEVGPTASWFRIGDDLTCSLQLMTHREGRRRTRWYRFHQACIARSVISAQFHILARLDPDRTAIRDFFVVPGYMYTLLPLTFGVRNPPSVDRYRITTLDAAIKLLVSEAGKPRQIRGIALH
jgi:DNA invertase Pin-like site-specific DNA recombinase